MPEIVISHRDIKNPQTITQKINESFLEKGITQERNEVTKMEDDFKKGVRVIRTRGNRKFFDMGRRG